MKTFNELHPLVLQWGEDRELFNTDHGATPLSQLRKFFEEYGELNQALNKQDREGIKDAIGDCQVCLINYAKLKGISISSFLIYEVDTEDVKYNKIELELLMLLIPDEICNREIEQAILSLEVISELEGFKPWECLNFAYNEIKDRKGKMINRTFVKE